ncbi:MAG: hypothetical protein M3416_03825, partial [Acidobacteriota bacterium]|nr:hypothetical protein [Acidobacteriota bacterium]
MGDPYSGEIYRLGEGQAPTPGHVPLTEEQAAELMTLDDRKATLQRMASQVGTSAAAAPAPQP